LRFAAFGWSLSERRPDDEETMSSPPEDDPLEMVTRYITGIEARCALQAGLLRKLKEDGRDTARAERVLRDLEATLSVLRERQRSLELDARSRRLLAASRERLSRMRQQTLPSHRRMR
jgi:hypothetical protein